MDVLQTQFSTLNPTLHVEGNPSASPSCVPSEQPVLIDSHTPAMALIPSFSHGKKGHSFLATWWLPSDCFLAMCIGVEAPQLGCQSCHLPRRTHLNSSEIILWCFPVSVYYLMRPWVMSIRFQVCSSMASTVQSKQSAAAFCWMSVSLPTLVCHP